jgi:hypothetical protein
MTGLLAFLNSPLGLLLVGAIVGAIGLFTWQRRDWLAKQKYLRAQVMLDRRINIIEELNADVGRLIAAATAPIVDIKKGASTNQRNQAILNYNDQQAEWFEAYSSYETMLIFYFSASLSEAFNSKVFKAYENVDITLSEYQRNPDEEHYVQAYNALQNIRNELRAWNDMALMSMHED